MADSFRELSRVQARDLIADVEHPFTWVNDAFGALRRSLSNGDLRGAMTAAFTHGATFMLEEVKAHCPVDTGNLRDSLYVTTEDASGEIHEAGHTVMDRHHPGHVGSLSVRNTFAYITTDVYYAYFLEFGTDKMEAKPFMRPAIDTGAGHVVEMVGDFVVTHIVSGFFGRVAVDIADIGLAHSGAGHARQKHGLIRDLAVAGAKHAVGRAAGNLGKKLRVKFDASRARQTAKTTIESGLKE